MWGRVVGPQVGNRDSQRFDRADPANGIALGEVFPYEITNAAARIAVTIRCGDQNGAIVGHNWSDVPYPFKHRSS